MEKFQLPDAEMQCIELAEMLRPHLTQNTLLVGIHTGGAWVAKKVAEIAGVEANKIGFLDISFYRDDFGKRGLHPQVKPTSLPLDVDRRNVILIDDVLFTGRTTRAAINELFDYGRPASIRLAVLADRGKREMPVRADFCPWKLALAENQELVLERSENGQLRWKFEEYSAQGQKSDALAEQAFIVDHKVKTTGFSRSALAERMCCIKGGAAWIIDMVVIQYFRLSITLCG